MEITKEEKLSFIKTNLKNNTFNHYLGRKGIAIDVLARRYNFVSENIDIHLNADYALISEYFTQYVNNKVENKVKYKY